MGSYWQNQPERTVKRFNLLHCIVRIFKLFQKLEKHLNSAGRKKIIPHGHNVRHYYD